MIRFGSIRSKFLRFGSIRFEVGRGRFAHHYVTGNGSYGSIVDTVTSLGPPYTSTFYPQPHLPPRYASPRRALPHGHLAVSPGTLAPGPPHRKDFTALCAELPATSCIRGRRNGRAAPCLIPPPPPPPPPAPPPSLASLAPVSPRMRVWRTFHGHHGKPQKLGNLVPWTMCSAPPRPASPRLAPPRPGWTM